MLLTGLKKATPALALLVVSLKLLYAGVAYAGTFQVNPIRITLSPQSSSTLLAVRNDSNETTRFQVTVFTWDQDRRGEMILKPTEDIIFYPTLLALEPGDQRNIRVGTSHPVASTEKSYRIFVEELPPLAKPETNGLRILTKMGVPIFIQPPRPNLRGHIEQMRMEGADFSFEIKNNGNVHFYPRGARVKGTGREGESIFERELRVWYILAGGTREYRLEIPRAECPKIQSLTVELDLGGKTLKEQFPLPPNACSG